jgi:hypothetical protein
LCDEFVYTKNFKDDPITINSEGKIVNGRYRMLALKTLGGTYVWEAQLSRWVKIHEVK